MDSEWINDLCVKVSGKVNAIYEIWNAIGIEGTRLQARKETLSSHLFTMLDEMYDEEIIAQQALSNSIKELKNKIQELEAELGFPCTPCTDSLSLVMLEKALFDRYKSVEEKAASINEAYTSLRKEEELLASRLDEPTAVILFRHVPNQDQMKVLKTNIDFLTMEKRSRILELSELRHDILYIHSAIDIESLKCNELISRLNAENALEILPLSKTFLSEVSTLRSQCKSLLSEVRMECDCTSEEILKLANRLNIDRNDLIDFDQPTSSKFLKELHDELKRLTEIRHQNLAVFIHNCQSELQELWDACRLSESERNLTLLRNDGSCSELVLERLEAEISCWKDFYRKHEEVFETLDSWQSTFSQFKEIEAKKKDPVILKNRGGILLIVDKQYKQMQRDLKRLESAIQHYATDEKHSNLSIHGLSLMEFLEASHQQHEDDKENEAQKRKLAQTKQAADVSRAGVGAKRQLATKRPGPKLLLTNTRSNATTPQTKKPRLDVTKSPFIKTPNRQFLMPTSTSTKSARKPGGMTSTPRHSREFLL